MNFSFTLWKGIRISISENASQSFLARANKRESLCISLRANGDSSLMVLRPKAPHTTCDNVSYNDHSIGPGIPCRKQWEVMQKHNFDIVLFEQLRFLNSGHRKFFVWPHFKMRLTVSWFTINDNL